MNGPMPRNPANPAGMTDQAGATHVPTGTRDVLPEEMAELRAISASVLKAFTDAGYGEVATPALEFEETMRIGDPAAADSMYRVPDKDGRQLALRFDSTIPIARLAATRYRDADTPLRFCYLQHVYRPIVPKRGQSREFLQIGMELLGLASPEGDAEAIALLCRVLEAAGLSDFSIAVGDVGFFPWLLEQSGVNGSTGRSARDAILHELQTRDFVGLERELAAIDRLDDSDRQRLASVAAARGGRETVDREGATRLAALDDLLQQKGVAERVIYDLGLVRETGYYTGTVLEIYSPSSGFPLGGGGRYDELVGRFGRDLAAFGFAINMERLHLAVIAEQEGTR